MADSTLLAGPAHQQVDHALSRINQAWLDRRPRDLAPLFDPDIVMVYPGFAERASGREALVDGFVDFCESARVHAFEEENHQIDVFGKTAVASFDFDMIYEREGQQYRSTGRDLWVFAREGSEWLAVWRTMVDVRDEPMPR